MRRIVFILAVMLLPGAGLASEPIPAPPAASLPADAGLSESILVVGDGAQPADGIPGSVAVIGAEELRRERPRSIVDAVRRVPGVNVRAEEPFGQMPSIGVRGLNPDRSEKMLLLEDGLPAALAPYNENAAYYVPPVQRLERIELLKGSGSVLHGPQTVGGVLNFVSPRPVAGGAGHLGLVVGTDGYALADVRHGAMGERFGHDVAALHVQGDGLQEDSAFELRNVLGRVFVKPTPTSEVVVRANVQDQRAQRTYLGLTSAMFEADPRRKIPKDDVIDVAWRDASITYRRFWEDAEISVAAYAVDAVRDWNRQDFKRNTGLAAPPADTVETVGDTTVDGGAVYMRSSFDSRDRAFAYHGIEPRLQLDWGKGRVSHRTWLGTRWHHEEMIDRRRVRATLGASPRTKSDELRIVEALAGWMQHEVRVGRFSIVPGLRVERYSQERDVRVKDFADSDAAGDTRNTELIPGLGATFRASDAGELYFGVHRGFAPPRTEAAITSSGDDLELDAERSWNWELGWRGRPCEAASFEVAAFLMDFENQVIPASESGGASTANVNGGATRHRGLEASGRFDVLALPGRRVRASRLELSGGFTLLEAENVTPGGLFEGQDLPYAPGILANVALDWIGASGFDAGLGLTHVGDQFADRAGTRAPSADGTIGEIPSRAIVDLRFRKRFSRNLETFVHVTNVLDEISIASRAPQGVFPGAFRQVLAGLRWGF